MSFTDVLPLPLELADNERRELAEVLVASVPGDDQVDYELLAELERRVDEARPGRVQLVNIEQSHAKLRATLAEI